MLLRKILLWFFVGFTIVLLGVYLFIEASGRQLLQKKLSEVTNTEVTIKDVRFIFPMGLRFDTVNVQGIAKAEEIRIQLGLPFKINKEYFITSISISDPVVFVARAADRSLSFQRPLDKKPEEETKSKKKQKNKDEEEQKEIKLSLNKDFSGVIIERLEVTNGLIKYSDSHSSKKLALMLKDVDIKAQKIAYPVRPVKTKYNFSAAVFNEEKTFSGSKVESEGWIDCYNKDMDGKIKIVESNGMIGLKADLKAKNNELNVSGKLNVQSLSGDKDINEESDTFSIDEFMAKAIKSAGIEISADFSFTTKLDDVQLSPIAISGKFGVGTPEKTSGSLPEDIKNFGIELYKKTIQPVVQDKNGEGKLPLENSVGLPDNSASQ